MIVMDGVQRRPAGGAVLDLTAMPQIPVQRPSLVRPAAITVDSIRRFTPPPAPAPVATVATLPASLQLAEPAAEENARRTFSLPHLPTDHLLKAAQIAVAVALVPASGMAIRNYVITHRPVPISQIQALKSNAPAEIAKTAPVSESAQLKNILTAFAAKQPAPVGIYVKNLKTGNFSSINDNQVFESASLYKLFVAQAIYKMVDSGQLSLSADAGGGTGMNVQQCLEIMINISSNECGRALGDIVGWGAQDQALASFGYKATSLADPQRTTPADVGLLLERLYNGTLLGKASTDQFISFLKDQRVNNRLPQGLPAGTVIAHKTGDLDNFVHDAGIVYGPKTDYLVVMMSGPWNAPAQAPAAFADLSQQLYAFFSQ